MALHSPARRLVLGALVAGLPALTGCPAPGTPGGPPPPCASDYQDAVAEAHRFQRLAGDATDRAADLAHPQATALREAEDRLEAACLRALDRSAGDPAALEASDAVTQAREAYRRILERAAGSLQDADTAVRALLPRAMAAADAADALPVDGACARVDAAAAYQFKASWLAATTRLAGLREGYRRLPSVRDVVDAAVARWRLENPQAEVPAPEEPPPVVASLPRVLGHVYGRVVRTEAVVRPVFAVYQGEELDPADEDAFDQLSCRPGEGGGEVLDLHALLEARECEIRLPILEGDDPAYAIEQVQAFLASCAADAEPEPVTVEPPEDEAPPCEDAPCFPLPEETEPETEVPLE